MNTGHPSNETRSFEGRAKVPASTKVLAATVALAALVASYVEWSRLGHRHTGGVDDVHHHHPHIGGHHHADPLAARHGGAHSPGSHSPRPGSGETPESAPETSGDVFVASSCILSLDLGPRVAADAPAQSTDSVDAPACRTLLRTTRHEPANPRGPPSA